MPPNLWLGITVVNQAEADRDIPKLLGLKVSVRFLSMDPLLGPVDLRFHVFSEPTGNFRTHAGKRQMELRKPVDGGLHWVIVGGESGPGARPMHPQWVRDIRDQCEAAGVPFLFKQHGEWLATDFCDDDMASIPSKRTVYVQWDGGRAADVLQTLSDLSDLDAAIARAESAIETPAMASQTTAAPTAPLKPHVFRQLVNDLRDLAKQYYGHDSLRDRISGRLGRDVPVVGPCQGHAAQQDADALLARIARAIWGLRREEEDRCDMELEDMPHDHSVWQEAKAAIEAMKGGS